MTENSISTKVLAPLGKPIKVYLSMAIQSFTNIKESNMVSVYAVITRHSILGCEYAQRREQI